MLTVCWSAKGGSGTTVVTCALALLSAAREETLLIDLAGDAAAALGVAEPSGPGVLDWIASTTAAPSAIEALAVTAAPQLRLVARGTSAAPDPSSRWRGLGTFLADSDGPVFVDAGTGDPPAELLSAAAQRLLVIRPCYLALRRAAASALAPTGVIVVHEPGRALRANDVGSAVGAPVIAEIGLDPAVSRAVDAGLLVARLPKALAACLRPVSSHDGAR